MEPFTTALAAIGAAQKIIGVVKQALNAGKEFQSLGPLLGSYFDAKDAAVKLNVKESGKKGFGGSKTGQAMTNILALKEMEDAEREIKEHLVYSGQGDLWDRIVEERIRLHREEQAAIAAHKKAVVKRKKKRDEMVEAIAVGAAAVILTCFIVYGIYAYMVYWRK